MKKICEYATMILCFMLCAVAFTACGETSVDYNVIRTHKTYEIQNSVSGVEIDEEIVLDGDFTESFYENRNWLVAYKNFNGRESYDGHSLGNRTATIKSTAYIAKKGVLLAFDIDDNYEISWAAKRGTAFNSGIELNFAFGEKKDARGNLFEIDLTAHGEFQIRCISDKFGGIGYSFYDKLSYELHPDWKIKLKGGSIASGECTGYTIELYLPYALFGETSRPDTIYLNPGIITPHSAAENELGRDRYDVGGAQSPALHPLNNIGALRFDANGFVSNKITIEAQGGTVTENFGRDWCLVGDEITFQLTPEEGKRLSSVKVNDVEMKDKVRLGRLSVSCTQDMNIVAVFADK